jgi:hypothetical protein
VRKMRRKRRAAGAILAFFAAAGVIVSPSSAGATDYCGSTDHGIWLIQSQPSGYGSQAQVQKINHSLVNCGGTGYTTSSEQTSGVLLTWDAKHWVEVGVMKYLYCTVGCSTSYKAFGEWGFYPNIVGGPFRYGNYTADGGLASLKANNVDGTFDWKIWWNPTGGTSYTLLDTFEGMNTTHGWAWGESSRFGKTGTDIDDHHYNMQFKNSSGVWKNIGTLICQNDTDLDNKWIHISDNEFRVAAGAVTC